MPPLSCGFIYEDIYLCVPIDVRVVANQPRSRPVCFLLWDFQTTLGHNPVDMAASASVKPDDLYGLKLFSVGIQVTAEHPSQGPGTLISE